MGRTFHFILLSLSVQTALAWPHAGNASEPTSPGSQLWAARFNDPFDTYDAATDLAIGPMGDRVFVTGSAGAGYTTLSYDLGSGQLAWIARVGTAYDQAQSIAVSPDGSRVFVTGGRSADGALRDFGTVAYDAASGQQLWSAMYGRARGDDYAFHVAVAPDGARVFVSGWSQISQSLTAPTVVAYDAETGSRLWTASATVDGNSTGLAVSPDGSLVYETGECCSATRDDYFTLAIDTATGDEVWQAEYNGPGHGQDAPLGLVVDPAGSRVFVTGLSLGRAYYEYATVAYDAITGDQRWVARFDGSQDRGGFGFAVGVSTDGETVYATGEVFTDLSSYGTVAYDASTGLELWASEFHSIGGYNIPSALAVAPDGSGVFVTGQGEMRSSFYFQTVAYEPSTGARRWVARYIGPDLQEDAPYSIGVSPDSTVVVVTGRSYGPTDADFATVAYEA